MVPSPELTYAIIGASADREKYGNKVLRDLHDNGYNAIPINPKGGEIEGIKVYPNVSDYPGIINVAVFVVPPEVTIRVLDEVNDQDINKVWFQPGSASNEAIEYCKEHDIECEHEQCIMVARAELQNPQDAE